MTPTEAKDFVNKHKVDFILAQFVDIHGVAKTKLVPADHLIDILSDGAGFAGFAAWGMGQGPEDHDFMAVGDINTLSLVPWQPGYARIVCDGTVDGKPWPFDTRHVMKQQIARLSERGWIMNTGLEPEFMLLARREDGTLAPADETDVLEKPCYDYKGLSRSRAVLEPLASALMEAGFDVYQIDHEDSNGQFEMNYTYTDALTSADRYVFFRMAANEIADDFGLMCTFMPKPFTDRTGSGMHMHISIASNDSANIFNDDADARGLGLSRLAYQFLGGLLKHARPLAALCVPYGRLELRLADSACNPYLAGAAMIAAGLDGIDNAIDPGEPQNVNFYELSERELRKRKVKLLPQTLGEALDELEASKLFSTQLGEAFIHEFLEVKRMEWVEYCRHISEWERDRLLGFY